VIPKKREKKEKKGKEKKREKGKREHSVLGLGRHTVVFFSLLLSWYIYTQTHALCAVNSLCEPRLNSDKQNWLLYS
jgi:hypothetical protein